MILLHMAVWPLQFRKNYNLKMIKGRPISVIIYELITFPKSLFGVYNNIENQAIEG